jgi:hypothetical protein
MPLVSSLAAQGRRHRRQSPRSTQTSTPTCHPQASPSARSGRGASFEEPAATQQPHQPAPAPLGEPRLVASSS